MQALQHMGTLLTKAGPHIYTIGRFRCIVSSAECLRFVCNSVWAFTLAPASPRGALTLSPPLCMGISPGRYTEIGLSLSPSH